MKIKNLLVTTLAVAAGLTLTACQSDKSEGASTSQEGEAVTLNFGAMGSIDTIPFVIAQENGYFEEEGIKVNLELFNAAKDRDAALQAGQLDGVLADETAIAIYQNSDMDMQITGATNGYWTLVATEQSNIHSLEDLKGKKIGISENTMIEYLADDITTLNGIAAEDFEKVAIPAMPARLEALRNNQIDAAILPAPFNETAITDGAVEIETIHNTDIMISVTAFLNSVIEQYPQAIQGFYNAYNKAVDYINSTDISEYEDAVIKTVGYSEETRGNIILPKFKHNYLPDVEKVQKVFDWATAKGLLTKDITAKDVLNNVATK